ncbi:hypothetical protein N9E05_04775 [Gammaproteobacteria bacterium]|nr:hypothetical protein [Gammaproteobacteria bacterium]|tara:strand:- start:56 stop:604 length:549 start_codon:yes stop_codon:yes gene_type:complete
MSIKIAICGKMGSGKTTLANNIIINHSHFKKHSLAAGVKKFARFVYDIPEEKKDRVLFQKIGDGARNELFEDIWITTMLRQCGEDEYLIVDDVRYYNEVIKLKEQGWNLIKINISNELQEQRIKKTYPNDWLTHLSSRKHNSETEMDTIPNEFFDLILEAKDDSSNDNKINVFLISKSKNQS